MNRNREKVNEKGVMMQKIFGIFLIFFGSFSFLFGNPNHIPVTRLVSPDDSKPMGYKEWRETVSYPAKMHIGKVGEGLADGDKINIVVNATLYPKLTYFLDPLTGQFITDLTNSGYSVSVDTMSMSSDPFAPETLRNFLIDEYNAGSIGAIFVGNLPIAWFQMMEVFWGSPPSYTDFPIDLFYMDLDGIWQDKYKKSSDSLILGSDSIYDIHSGNMAPDFFVGRLTAAPVGNDSAMIYDYFERNHNYRIGSLNLSKEALFYIDDDWAYSSGQWSGDLGLVYDSILVVNEPETTTADDYRTRLPVSHEWVSLFAHSWPGGHAFKCDSGASWSWFYSYEIPTINPVANFYNLFACSNARYTESQYSAGMYTFRNAYGLGALGSAKTGSMLEFQYFYNPLSQGKCLGDAFKDWFAIMGETWADTSRSWFYGMTLIGDPTLVVKDSSSSIAETIDRGKRMQVIISPNPASQFVNFTFSDNTNGLIEISVYTIDGRKVYAEKQKGISRLGWDCSELPAGIYFCNVVTQREKFSNKIIIVK